MTTPSPKPVITLDELVALNDEIAALVRAGIPLDQGLRHLGDDLPGRLGRFASRLSEEIARGTPLAEALAQPSAKLPRLYRAVVEAGVAAGRLPAALESLAGSLRRLAQSRRSVVLALIYPLILFLIAWQLFAFSAQRVVPVVYDSFRQAHIGGGEWFRPIVYLGKTAGVWGPIGPAVAMGIAFLWWIGSRRAAAAQGDRAVWAFGWIPGMGRMLRVSRTAVFVEVLKLLVENRLPMDRAMLLAAEAAGDASLVKAAERFAAAVRRGEACPEGEMPDIPPLVRWLIAGSRQNELLVPALQHAADDYQRRARYEAELVWLLLPVMITCCVSAVIVTAYALVLLAPYFGLLRALCGVYKL